MPSCQEQSKPEPERPAEAAAAAAAEEEEEEGKRLVLLRGALNGFGGDQRCYLLPKDWATLISKRLESLQENQNQKKMRKRNMDIISRTWIQEDLDPKQAACIPSSLAVRVTSTTLGVKNLSQQLQQCTKEEDILNLLDYGAVGRTPDFFTFYLRDDKSRDEASYFCALELKEHHHRQYRKRLMEMIPIFEANQYSFDNLYIVNPRILSRTQFFTGGGWNKYCHSMTRRKGSSSSSSQLHNKINQEFVRQFLERTEPYLRTEDPKPMEDAGTACRILADATDPFVCSWNAKPIMDYVYGNEEDDNNAKQYDEEDDDDDNDNDNKGDTMDEKSYEPPTKKAATGKKQAHSQDDG